MFLSFLTNFFAAIMYLTSSAIGIASFIPISEIAAHKGRIVKHTYNNITANAKFNIFTVTLLVFMAFITLSNISFSSSFNYFLISDISTNIFQSPIIYIYLLLSSPYIISNNILYVSLFTVNCSNIS